MKALLFAVAAVFFAGCFNPTDEGSGEDKYSSKTQEIVVLLILLTTTFIIFLWHFESRIGNAHHLRRRGSRMP